MSRLICNFQTIWTNYIAYVIFKHKPEVNPGNYHLKNVTLNLLSISVNTFRTPSMLFLVGWELQFLGEANGPTEDEDPL